MLPMTIGDIFDEAFDLYKNNFALFAGIVALVQVPAEIGFFLLFLSFHLNASSFYSNQPNDVSYVIGFLIVWSLVLILWSFLFVMQNSALTIAISEKYLGKNISIFGAYKRSLPFFWRLNVTWGIISLAMLAFIFILSPVSGIITAVMVPSAINQNNPSMGPIIIVTLIFMSVIGFASLVLFVLMGLFITQIIVVEGKSSIQSIQRNFQLILGRFWRVVGFTVLLSLIVLALSVAFMGTLSAAVDLLVFQWVNFSQLIQDITDDVLFALIWMFIQPFWMTCLTLLYYDHRVRMEGFDLSLLDKQMAGDFVKTVASK